LGRGFITFNKGEAKMSNPPSLFEMFMTAWGKMVMAPWQTDVKIEEDDIKLSASMFENIEDVTIKRITKYNYDKMSEENKERLIKEYRVKPLLDPEFDGYWMLIPADGSVALRDSIDREIIADLIREAEKPQWPEGPEMVEESEVK
jgi:hypothetical protein